MTINKVENFICNVNELKRKAGKFQTIKYQRQCKVLKSCPYEITKVTIASSVRVGCQYDNLGRVKQKRMDGELPSENVGLRGMKWVEYPFLLESEKTGEQYLRVELCKNSKFTSQYYVGNKMVSKESIMEYLTASEKKSGDMPDIINIKVKSLMEV